MVTKLQAEELKNIAVNALKHNYLRKNGSWLWSIGSTMNCTLESNCLPAHLAIIGTVRQWNLGKDPIVVIGCMKQAGVHPTNNEIKYIEKALLREVDPHCNFHAWIQLDATSLNSDILDITGALWANVVVPNGVLDKQSALSHNIELFPVLTDEEDVYSYHASLVYEHIIAFGARHVQHNEILLILEKFSQQQNITRELAFGGAGKMILEESTNKRTTSGFWGKFVKIFKPTGK